MYLLHPPSAVEELVTIYSIKLATKVIAFIYIYYTFTLQDLLTK